MSKDNKARYGSKMQWDAQRAKQQAIADERDARLHGEVINNDED